MNLAHFGYQSRERRLTAKTKSTAHARIILLFNTLYYIRVWVYHVKRKIKIKIHSPIVARIIMTKTLCFREYVVILLWYLNVRLRLLYTCCLENTMLLYIISSTTPQPHCCEINIHSCIIYACTASSSPLYLIG
jgi:hypothetical protein